MIPTPVYVKNHPRSQCWSSFLLRFKQTPRASTSPRSLSLTKRIHQHRYSEVLGETHQPHVPPSSTSVSDSTEFVVGVHRVFKDHSGWLCKDLASDKSHTVSFASKTYQAFPKLHWNVFIPCESGILGNQRLLCQGSLLTDFHENISYNRSGPLTDPFLWPVRRNIDPFTLSQAFWLYWKYFFYSGYTWLCHSFHCGHF